MRRKAIDAIQKYGKSARGRRELIEHLDGIRLTMREAILAKCYDCCGQFADGKTDCRVPRCPLHPFMAYREGEKQPFIKRPKRPPVSLGSLPGPLPGIFPDGDDGLPVLEGKNVLGAA